MPLAIASSVGIKLAPQDVELGFRYKAMQFNSIKRELKWQADQLRKDRKRNMIDADEYEIQMQRIQKKMKTLQEHAAKVFGKK